MEIDRYNEIKEKLLEHIEELCRKHDYGSGELYLAIALLEESFFESIVNNSGFLLLRN